MNGYIVGWIAAEIVLAVVLALLIRRYFFLFVLVKGRSMRPTLEDGDVMFVLRYRGQPVRRGDVVICRFPQSKHMLVKRVVALPGETVSIEDGRACIDGTPLEEPYARIFPQQRMDARGLEAGEYFVLGDNRLASRDSRSLGPLHAENIYGRCAAVILPLRRRKRLG